MSSKLAFLSVQSANIAIVQADGDATIRDGQFRPVSRAAVDQAWSLFAEFSLGTFRHPERMLAQRDGVLARDDRQHVAQQTTSDRVGHQRRPACLQLEPLRRNVERALAIRERELGPEHPDTAASPNNLAYLLQAQGDLADGVLALSGTVRFRADPKGPSEK